MSKLDEITLADVARSFARYRPYIALVAGIALVVGFLPGESRQSQETAAGSDVADVGEGGGFSSESGGIDDGEGFDLEGPNGGAAARRAGRAGGSTAGGGGTGTPGGGGGGGAGVAMVPNCDPNTGLIAIPSLRAPQCVPAFSGDNGGVTSPQGVDGSTIKVAVYRVREDAATSAVLTAAGVNDSEEDQRKQYEEWARFYEAHYETYGRKVELHFVPASGDSTDDAAARQDALHVAKGIKAFASWEGGNNTYVDELKAHGVMCFCTTSQPIEAYLGWAPYVWSTLMASSQAYIHRAEYIGKRLAGANAKWAGDPLFKKQKRVFGLVYYDTDDKAYKPGADFFEEHLRERYGVKLAAKLEYHGYPNVARSQAEALPLIQALVRAGVNAVICACDPFGPVFFTKEASRQEYYPEWIVTGSALTDTSFFARTYDERQWRNAFGISFLTARMPEVLDEDYRLLKWHYGRGPVAEGRYGVIRLPIELFYRGLHHTGPNLNPKTFTAGMFNAPVSGHGHLTVETISFGRKGLWPWDDYLAYDDVTEIWWDPHAEGEDEVGQHGDGLYRYVDGGKRYLPGEHPKAPPRAFDPAGTVTIYAEPPPSDRWPDYPPPGG